MRIVVITGVSRGLGAALVDEVLKQAGTRVLALGRSFPAGLDTDRVTTRRCDFADPASLPGAEELRTLLAGAAEVCLVHNAAVVEPIGVIGELPADAATAAVTINFTTPVLLTNALVAAVAPTVERVRVVFVSSGAAHRVINGWSIYSATKRGGEEFFAHLAAEHADDPRWTVASVNPGVMDTGMQETVRQADFIGQDRFLGLHERGELPDPATVARRIVAEHLPE
jgi:benzil reductase ((S)-benzoin forming)